MQRVWNFPIDTKQGCPQDRESSGHVGVRVKKIHTYLFVCKQTLLSGCVCVCTSAYLHQQILILRHIAGFGGVGGLDKPEERKLLPALWRCVHPPCLSHQHWPEPGADSAVTCDDGEERHENYVYEFTSRFAVREVPGTAETFQRAKSLLPTWQTWMNPKIFPAARLRSHLALPEPSFSFTAIYTRAAGQAPEQPLLASRPPPPSKRVSVCRAGSQGTQSTAPRAPL